MQSLELAHVSFKNTIYLAKHDPVREGFHSPSTAITKLIQGIYEIAHDQAHHILRRRIYATAAPSALCWGMTKVAARKLSWQARLEPSPFSGKARGLLGNFSKLVDVTRFTPLAAHASLPAQFGEPAFSPGARPWEILDVAKRLAASVPRHGARYLLDRPIASIMLSAQDEVLGWGINSNGRNRTLHAEVNMIQGYYQRVRAPIPAGAKIYTTLKPCRMCAGMIWHCSEDVKTIKVYYAEFDPGPNARRTILNAHSPDRHQAANSKDALRWELEEQIRNQT